MVGGQPLFSWALKGLPSGLASELTLITSRKVADDPSFERCIRDFVPRKLKLTVEVLGEPTSGQAETVLLGTRKTDSNKGLLIFNCDTYISDDFPREFGEYDGLLGSFKSENPGMSYLQTEGNRVIRTVEKEVISDVASTGLYYFATKEIFQKAYFDTKHLKESYVAPIYNSMIRKNLNVGYFMTQTVIPLGTSQDIESFQLNRPTSGER
jgi:dTDP-glucose pyrophosphorylase